MNKKLIISLLSLVILLVIVFIAITLFNKNTSNIRDDGQKSSLSMVEGNITTSTNNFGCPVNQVPVTVMNSNGTKKTFCSSVNDSYPIGTGKEIYSLKGYYSTYDITMYPFDYDTTRDPLPATTTCSSFTVIGGDSDFIRTFEDIVQSGNTVNKINKNNNLVLNIDLSDLEATEKKAVVNSNPERLVTLKVNVKSVGGRDANYCESNIRIISTN